MNYHTLGKCERLNLCHSFAEIEFTQIENFLMIQFLGYMSVQARKPVWFVSDYVIYSIIQLYIKISKAYLSACIPGWEGYTYWIEGGRSNNVRCG